MSTPITIPALGESVKTGILAVWLKQNGDSVSEGDELFELETDKATSAFPSPVAGTLEILVAAGAEVEVGQQVATIASATPAAAAGPPPVPAEQARGPEPMAEPAPASESMAAATAARGSPPAAGRPQRREAMTAIRRRTAERLVAAKQQTAYVTTFNEIDMTQVTAIRARYREAFEKEHGVKIGFMSFFVKASCQALKECPIINAMIDGTEIVYRDYYDLGVAISIDAGLVVPVIRNADTLHFAEIETTIAALAMRARDRKLLPDDLAGGTFTITNGGVFGSLLSTPIPAYPQSAILGMHAVKKRPVVVDDQIVIRTMMYVALTYDHRLIDGRDAVGFLVRIKDFIEEPETLLLEL